MIKGASYFIRCFFYIYGGSIRGIIYKIESKDYYVLSEGNKVRCSLKGKFKKTFALKKDKQYKLDIAVVGDRVEYDLNDDGTGVLTSIKDRTNYISRKAPKIKGSGYRGERLEQVIASNIDSLFVVTSIRSPKFNERLVDRIIVAGESSKVRVKIIINKADLDEDSEIEFWKKFYTNLGYQVFVTTATKKRGIKELQESLTGEVSLFWGTSGVGKSSLLNAIFPHLEFEVGDISESSDKGKHTTVTSIMSGVGNNTFVIDTPGIREIDPYGIKKEDLGHYFREFSDYIHDCRFNTCTHHHEPGCAVISALENEKISPLRYQSYLNLLDTIEEDMVF